MDLHGVIEKPMVSIRMNAIACVDVTRGMACGSIKMKGRGK